MQTVTICLWNCASEIIEIGAELTTDITTISLATQCLRVHLIARNGVEKKDYYTGYLQLYPHETKDSELANPDNQNP